MSMLQDKVAIITGASSGIGYAAAKLFAREGAAVVVTARRQAELDQLAKEIRADGGTVIAVAGDIQNEAHSKRLVETALEKFGGLDIAFNNAGIMGDMGPTADMELVSWQKTMDTNLTGPFLGAKHQIPAMLERGGGSIIFTSTFVGHTAGFPGTAAYAASKAGLTGLTQTLAAEYGPQGIRVNELLVGATDTPMGRAFASDPETLKFVVGLYALKRLAQPEEIARSALYLASDASSFTTGASMAVDGGVAINRT